MSQVVSATTQEEYEDDFEKDLDWLISEESRSEDQVSQYRLVYYPTYLPTISTAGPRATESMALLSKSVTSSGVELPMQLCLTVSVRNPLH